MNEISNSREQTKLIDRLFAEEKWNEAKILLLEWLKQEPTSHWLLTRISGAYYEEKAYKEALEYAEKALKIAPHCPLVLWDYGTALDMLERDEEAIQVYRKLLKRGVTQIAHGQCGEGIPWARSLLNDVRYRLGLMYAVKGNFLLADKYVSDHIKNRNNNCRSIYHLRDVKRRLVKIREGKDPRSD